ncbi:LysR family transcriptional regulator [Roseobacter sinensis]|uniref:LysR family transcriptional regulator n=1 Tax=Roseobacter sinensis TaxID=2931391 RepID=A0ABT3B9E6_9RHOB|nr:LysR family transcriptional regulator [Roseobacter sp. WL0113]MCV3270168.1 LysR family transcriptional regulator [Roseobacter sp. WL0113]
MPLPKLSLHVLEAFEHVARSGSIQIAAGELGASISTVSGHVAKLEAELGVPLFDRSTRPFVLTREGRRVLEHLSGGLRHLRQATSEIAMGGLLRAQSLRVGIVEDFESNLAPDLAVALAGRMPRASLSICNILSHEAPGLVQRGKLDVAIAAHSEDQEGAIVFRDFLRDPFLLATPRGCAFEPEALLNGSAALPFLRFNPTHLIGKQIDAHLARNRIALPQRFAFDSAQSIMAVIANGDGWSLITPAGFVRAQRYAPHVMLRPLPMPAFARTLSVMTRDDFDAPVLDAIALLVRESVKQHAVDPVVDAYPWVRETFALLPRKRG